MKTCVLIPAHNEEPAIAKVIDAIPKDLVSHFIVINCNSSDNTGEIAKLHGAQVYHQSRKGYGLAILSGVSVMPKDTEIIVILDGDFSDFPEKMSKLLKPILQNEADFVLSSRTMGTAEPGSLTWSQIMGNRLACWLIAQLFNHKYTDMGPFRALTTRAFHQLKLQDKTYGWNAEMQVKAVIEKLRILEVPVNYRQRIGVSKISGSIKGTVLAGSKIIGMIIKLYVMLKIKQTFRLRKVFSRV